MAYNIKTAIKIFLIFLFFQLTLQSIIEITNDINPSLTEYEDQYLNFLTTQTNPSYFFSGRSADVEPETLLQSFKSSMPSENTYNDSILNTFLGIYKIISASIKFIIAIIFAILFVPSVIINVIFYNFVSNSSFLIVSVNVFANISFYAFMYYLVFREGIK